MSYGFQNNYGGGFSQGGNRNYQNYRPNYSRSGGGNGYGNRYGNGYRPKKKNNGAKAFTGKNGTQYLSGWFVDKRAGLVKVLIYANAKSGTIHTSKSGREWQTLRAKVTYVNQGRIEGFNALQDMSTKTVTIKDLNICVSPNKNYCGPFFKSDNRR